MNKYLIKIVCIFIPSKKLRKKFRLKSKKNRNNIQLSELEIVKKYLLGLNGIEIGGSSNNDFYLERYGAYCNVNFSRNAWKNYNCSEKVVNIVANGDDLPFKNDSLDYVFSSHVMEHFFDPIKAIKEHLRVVKNGGYLFMIIPHKEKMYDKDREVTTIQEFLDRNSEKITIQDYYYAKDGKGYRSEESIMIGDTHILVKNIKKIPNGYIQFKEDDHHHWSVWTTESFLDLCNKINVNLIEYSVCDIWGGSFIIIIKK